MHALHLKKSLALIAVIALLFAACSSDKNDTPPEDMTNIPANTVFIKDYKYAPAKLTVKKGTTVMWKNTDAASHTVTSNEEGGPKSALLKTNDGYEFKFDKVGTFSYYCQPHPYMKAEVVVTES